MWPCEIAGGQVKVGSQLVFKPEAVLPNGEAWCCLPGDSFRVVENGQSAESSWIPLEAKVGQIIPGIGVVQIQAMAGDLALTLCVAGERAEMLSPGQQIRVAFQKTATHIIKA